jgi:pantothenate kinase-related protein Tda10
VSYTVNLTSDKETGIGQWRKQDEHRLISTR